MKDWKRTGLAMASVAILLPAAGGGQQKESGKPTEPFFHQFLIPGNPLDEKLLAQEKRVAENPGSAALRNDYGNLLAERRFPKEARAEYKKALKLDSNFFLAAYNLGMMEETVGQISKAISAYREAINRRRGFPPAHFRLGRLYEKQGGRDDDAIAEYAKAISINNSMRDPRVNPLVVDSHLIDRASLVNYPQDVARAAFAGGAEYVEVARFRTVPVDRPLDSDEVVEDAGPQTIETRKTAPSVGNRAPAPVRPGTVVRTPAGIRRDVAPRPGLAPVPTPIPIEAPPEPPPEPPEPEPEPQP
jgi:tetratricopeptide (TPR) repeat protein